MIIVDQLRISDDGKRMFINAHVNKAHYFQDITIKSVTIIPADKVSETSPGIPNEHYVYKKEFDDSPKEISLILSPTDFNLEYTKSNFSGDLFFVYFEGVGTPSSDTPCRLDENIILKVTFDEALLYQRVMGYTKNLVAQCAVQTDFVDFILLWNAFKASVETEHYIEAVKFFNMLFDSTTSSGYTNVKGCGCHG